VYSQREILLLDDVLSGLDGRTIDAIFTRLLGRQGLLRKSGVTVILATHAGMNVREP
jgi:ATP-binding cassette, subfamily C (CFTR/MRP), member 1